MSKRIFMQHKSYSIILVCGKFTTVKKNFLKFLFRFNPVNHCFPRKHSHCFMICQSKHAINLAILFLGQNGVAIVLVLLTGFVPSQHCSVIPFSRYMPRDGHIHRNLQTTQLVQRLLKKGFSEIGGFQDTLQQSKSSSCGIFHVLLDQFSETLSYVSSTWLNLERLIYRVRIQVANI